MPTSATTEECSPSSVPVSSASSCTATVSDTYICTGAPPAATYTLSLHDALPISSGGTCTLPISGTNSCSVTYTPSAGSEGANGITGTYSGDTDHSGSAGNDTVTEIGRAHV